MGNRAVITTAPFSLDNVGIYLHWNGGIESVEAFCAAARELGFRAPDPNGDVSYGFARLVGLICLFFDITTGTSVGVDVCRNLDCDGDNGVFLIGKDWQIVGHLPGSDCRKPVKPPKNEDPEKTHAVRSRLVIGARLVATTFKTVEPSQGTTKKAA